MFLRIIKFAREGQPGQSILIAYAPREDSDQPMRRLNIVLAVRIDMLWVTDYDRVSCGYSDQTLIMLCPGLNY